VLPPELKSAAEAVKLASPALLLASIEKAPAPLPTALACPPGATRNGPKPAASAPPPVPVAVPVFLPTPPPPPPPPPGTQFSLLDAAEPGGARIRHAPPQPPEPRNPTPPPSVAPTPAAQEQAPPAPAVPPAVPTFKLNAPMRMNPAVRDALAAIVGTLNGPGSAAAAAPVAAGLFLPLRELELRGVQPALAARALADVGLLVHAKRDGPATVSCNFRGEPTIGLVVAPACIEGFDPAAFEPAAPVEH
jgi:conjugal transfer pilus assembly protein TraI